MYAYILNCNEKHICAYLHIYIKSCDNMNSIIQISISVISVIIFESWNKGLLWICLNRDMWIMRTLNEHYSQGSGTHKWENNNIFYRWKTVLSWYPINLTWNDN